MGSTVLIVEDQSIDRQILAEMVRYVTREVEIEAFAYARAALEWLRGNQPELILADYRLPGMDGIAFLQACSEIPHCAGIPIVMITVVHDPDLRRRVLEAGATDFLTKPLDVQECRARCRNLLTLRQQQLKIARDAKRLAEARNRTQRALQILSQGNKLLVQAHSKHQLLEGICELIVEEGAYPLAWVRLEGRGERGPSQAVVSDTGGSGVAEGTGLPLATWREILERAQPWLIDDLADEGGHRFWARALCQQGFRALLLLPIQMEGVPTGILGVLARQPGVFDDEELELMARIADNLGYGIAALQTEQAREQAERNVNFLLYYDPLTGLPNRTSLLKQLRRAIAEGKRPAIFVINLDRFKIVNETSGHEAGDRLLLRVVERLHAVSRQEDLLARVAGDEFILLAQGGSPKTGEWDWSATHIAERLVEVVSQPFQLEGFEYHVGASIGITYPLSDREEVQALLSQADAAMHQAKALGGNTYTFYSGELTERHTQRLALEGLLHRAIEERHFVLVYQPIVHLATGQLIGVEALLRWPQEDGSLLGPESFIDLAEDTGLMIPLGRWAFWQACQQARAWVDQGLDLYVSVNLSTHQLLSPTLVREIQEAVNEVGISPARLELEITEGGMMADPSQTTGVLEELHSSGLRIAVDDFGTGYSSLSRLKYLPISTLKIDKDFVLGLPYDANDRTIVSSIISLATNLGMRVLAEGVETEQHRKALIELGCVWGQGFHLGYPQLPGQLIEASSNVPPPL